MRSLGGLSVGLMEIDSLDSRESRAYRDEVKSNITFVLNDMQLYRINKQNRRASAKEESSKSIVDA